MTVQSPIPILYEDEQFICFDKPSGLLVIPSPKGETNTLTRLVNELYAPADHSWKLHPCHRLDRETSGVMAYAKGKRNQQLLMETFHRLEVKKTYLALVQGRLTRRKGELRSHIRDLDQRKFTRKSPGKLAVTEYKVVQEKETFSVVEIYPVTGRTNQIRIQFSQFGHPILGDRKYGRGRDFSVRFRRTALHAKTLQFPHPATHRTVHATAPIPPDMRLLMEQG
jgi:23S rRNA pseudouridine1911/1915/1917 synthase